MNETCKWRKVKDLIWLTSCDHSIGTPRKWEPKEGEPCMACKKPMEVLNESNVVVHDGDNNSAGIV